VQLLAVKHLIKQENHTFGTTKTSWHNIQSLLPWIDNMFTTWQILLIDHLKVSERHSAMLQLIFRLFMQI